MDLALILPPYPNERWRLALQLGVTHVVTTLPFPVTGAHMAWSQPGAPQPIVPRDVPPPEQRPWDYLPLLHMQQRFADAGLTVSVIESSPPLHRARLGLPGRDEEIEWLQTLIRNMGRLGIPVLCWNWMAVINWARTSTTTPTRGGALVTSYDHELMQRAGLTEAGEVSPEQLWNTLAYFLEAVVPVAEEAGVKLALHPDDPPVPSLRGIARILITPEAMQRAIDLVPSQCNGITFCQGTFSTMGVDIPTWIRHFGRRGAIHFVHFRDVRGRPEKFVETFHDDGQTDMFEAMRTYYEVGFTGVMRPDHVPTMEGEPNDQPGYQMLGRLYAIGYMRGLQEGVRALARGEATA
uniref:mannonate dehydratase n=1 Tax=Thermorudis peleae TaxID=1382356 RepID=A0A831WYV4_9BACT